jgi:hypothetical protein
MMKKKLCLICLLLLAVAVWTEGTVFARKAKAEREVSLKAGREAFVKEAGLRIRFVRLVEDSRCPEGVDCVWAGNGKISITVRKGKRRAASFELNTMTEPTSVSFQGYEIKLVKLDPYPKKDVEHKKGEYVATLKVSRK